MGAWIILSAWIVGDSPDTGVVLNNVIIGGLTLLLGMVCVDTAARSGKGDASCCASSGDSSAIS